MNIIHHDIDRRKVTDFEEYWNGFFTEKPVKVGMMEAKVSKASNEMLITTAGSGIAVCLNDKERGIGGMAHILPFGTPAAITALLNDMLERLAKLETAPETLKAKLFGGSNLTANDAGAHNIHALIKDYLIAKQIPITIEEIGGNVGRRIHFFPKSGKVVRRLLQRQIDRDELLKREQAFRAKP